MKAPDKLYISQLIYGTWQYQTPDPDDETQVEYIRKDALMEWAKECFRLQDGGSWYSKGAADAFSKVIDKINSL